VIWDSARGKGFAGAREEDRMSDGREEREAEEQRCKWEKERKDRDDDMDRDWEKDGERERRDSRAVQALDAYVRAELS
jgi:hypothetical protein